MIENLTVRLFINGKQRALSTLKIEANAQNSAKLIFNNHSTGTQEAYLELSDATIDFDNKLYFNFAVEQSTKVLCIHQGKQNLSLTSLFNDPIFDYTSIPVGEIRFSEFKNQNLIILNGLTNPTTGLINNLKEFTSQGGNLLIYPSKTLNFNSYKALSKSFKPSSVYETK